MGTCIENFDVLLAYKPTDYPPKTMMGAISIELDENTLSQKLQAARDYSELSVDVERILEQEPPGSLNTEYLRRVHLDSHDCLMEELPYYEAYGERQVAAGHYQRVIRYRDHVLPLADALQQYAERSTGIADPDYK
jgi:hypothetical protein